MSSTLDADLAKMFKDYADSTHEVTKALLITSVVFEPSKKNHSPFDYAERINDLSDGTSKLSFLCGMLLVLEDLIMSLSHAFNHGCGEDRITLREQISCKKNANELIKAAVGLINEVDTEYELSNAVALAHMKNRDKTEKNGEEEDDL